MTISVVIPVYNEASYLPACLESLRKQTLPPDEIIIVDNNSTDRTARIAKDFGAKVINEPKQGIVFARNTGFDAARGDIIARGDADSIFPTDWLAEINRTLSGNRYAAITGGTTAYDLPWPLNHVPTLFYYGHIVLYFGWARLWLGHTTLFGSNMAITNSGWQKVRREVCTNEQKIHEDVDLAYHICRASEKIKFDRHLRVSISIRVLRIRSLRELVIYASRVPRTRLSHHH